MARRADEMFIPGVDREVVQRLRHLADLGPDSRIRTPVYQRGSRTGDRLDGDLILVGAGDVTFGGRTRADGTVEYTNVDHVDANTIPGATLTPQNPLAGVLSLAQQIRASGLRRVSGDVVVDDRLFSSICDPEPTPIMINDNLIDVLVRPAAAGQAATLSVRPARRLVHGDVFGADRCSRPADRDHRFRVGARSDHRHRQHRRRRRTAPAGGTHHRRLGLRANDVDRSTRGRRCARRRRAHGCQPGRPSCRGTSQYPSQSRVAEFVSPVYAEQAKLILKVSLNLGANLAICQLAVRAGSADCEDGFAPLRTFLAERRCRRGECGSRRRPRRGPGRPGHARGGHARFCGTGASSRLRPLADLAADPRCRRQPGLQRDRVPGPRKGLRQDGHGGRRRSRSTESSRCRPRPSPGTLEGPDGSWRVFDIVVNNAGASRGLSVRVVTAGEDVAEVAAALWEEAQER